MAFSRPRVGGGPQLSWEGAIGTHWRDEKKTESNMKKLLYILTAVVVLASCGKNGDDKLTLEQKVCTEWHSTQLPVSGDIYIDFNDDKTFELYQQIGEGAYRLYRGTWNLEGDLLTGRYNDGEDWACAYTVVIADKTMTLTSSNDAAEVSIYEKAGIPASVKESCVTVVKSL
jgi:hypothetical protein